MLPIISLLFFLNVPELKIPILVGTVIISSADRQKQPRPWLLFLFWTPTDDGLGALRHLLPRGGERPHGDAACSRRGPPCADRTQRGPGRSARGRGGTSGTAGTPFPCPGRARTCCSRGPAWNTARGRRRRGRPRPPPRA